MKLGAARSDYASAWRLLHITLGRQLHAFAPGLTARSALDKFAAVQMIDVHIPTTEIRCAYGREVKLTRYTQPEPDLQLLLGKLNLQLPTQPPPRITSDQARSVTSL